MFIYSMRAGTVRFVSIVCIALVALVLLIAFVPHLEPVSAATGEEIGHVSYENVKTNEDRIAFLASLGWQVEPEAAESTTVKIPTTFDTVFSKYNELQRTQGLDLSKYSGKTVERYTYRVTNYEGYEGMVLANLLVLRGRVIGGDVCSADTNGFIRSIQK